jgi:ankyrin repeat protein
MAAQEAVDAIFRAARERNVGELVRLLDAQPDLIESINGSSLLYEAARGGQANVVRVLLARGADVNRGDSIGRPPIYGAALCGMEDVVIVLLRAGANIRCREDPGRFTAFKVACYQNNLGVTRLLLRHMRGEGLDDRAEGGKTALWWACYHKYAEICRGLLLAGADHTLADRSGVTPRQAAQHGVRNPCMAVFEVGALSTSQTPGQNNTVIKFLIIYI